MNRTAAAILAAFLFLAAGTSAYTLFDETFASNASVNASWNTQDFGTAVWSPFVESAGTYVVQPNTGTDARGIFQTANPTNWTELSSDPTRPLVLSVLFKDSSDNSSTLAPFVGWSQPANGTLTFGSGTSQQQFLWAAVLFPTGGAGETYQNFSRFDYINAVDTYNSSVTFPADLAAGIGNSIAGFGATTDGASSSIFTDGTVMNWTTRLWSNGTACATVFSADNATRTASFCWPFTINSTGGANPLQSLKNFTAAIGWYGNGNADNLYHPHRIYRAIAYLGVAGSGAGGAGQCADGTAGNACSTTYPPYFCDNSTSTSTLVYNPNVCSCPTGQAANGTACAPAVIQPKLQTPIQLVAWAAKTCPTLSGRICTTFGGCSPGYDVCDYVVSGLDSLDTSKVGTRIYARYTATAEQRVVSTVDTNNSIRTSTAGCTVRSNPDGSLLPIENMAFDASSGTWYSSNINVLAEKYAGGFPTFIVTCTSAISNSNIYATSTMQNTPPWEVNVHPIAVAGQETAVTDSDNLFANLIDYSSVESSKGINRATTADSPILFRIFTRPPVQSGVSGILNGFLGVVFNLILAPGVFERSDPSTYSASACILTYYNTSTFQQPGEVPWGNSFLPIVSAGKISNLVGGSTVYGRAVANNVKNPGDYPYTFTCNPAETANQPGISARESLTINETCAGPDLASQLSVEYTYGNATQKTNVTNQFYYGTTLGPVVTYTSINGSNPGPNNFGDCLLQVTNASGNLATFQTGVSGTGVLKFPTAIQAGRYYFTPTFPYANGFLPVGNYTFTYTCNNRNQLFCSGPATSSSTVQIVNTPGACLGTSDSCGITTCSTPCPDDNVICEDGANVLAVQACVSQRCVSRSFSSSLSADTCRAQGHEVYTTEVSFPTGSDIVCETPVTIDAAVLKGGVVWSAANGTCDISVKGLGLGASSLDNNHVAVEDGHVRAVFQTGTGQGKLACGRDYVALVTCNSGAFLGAKRDSKTFKVQVDAICAYKGETVKAGCVFQTTKVNSDRSMLCRPDGQVVNDPATCGCPNNYNANGTVCVQSRRGPDILGLSWLNFTSLIAIILVVLAIFLMIKIKAAVKH